jgi:hypothetical protein
MGYKLDYKKENKDLYIPKKKPSIVDVPSMNFIMVDGKGDPSKEEYQQAIGALYALTYTIKMSKTKGKQPPGYFEYVVPPLEGLWWISGESFSFDKRDNWLWTSMIRQPEFVDPEMFAWACEECRRKKQEVDISKARLETFTEGLCVQMMHIGPYSQEPETLAFMRAFMAENGLVDETGSDRKHHEIYLSDPRKTTPDKLKTVLRHPAAYC